jgi:hypothetical protein
MARKCTYRKIIFARFMHGFSTEWSQFDCGTFFKFDPRLTLKGNIKSRAGKYDLQLSRTLFVNAVHWGGVQQHDETTTASLELIVCTSITSQKQTEETTTTQGACSHTCIITLG